MPTYDYKCPLCGVFERFQKFSEDPLKTCPDCGQDVKKLLSVPNIVGVENVPTTVAPTYRHDRSPVWNSAQAE